MKLLTKIVLLAGTAIGLATAMNAGLMMHMESGGPQASMSSTWYLSVPAGATVRSIATATVGNVSNPGWYYGHHFAALPPNRFSVITDEHGNIIDVHDFGAGYSTNYGGYVESNPSPSYATAVAGIAGPPAGTVHEARATISGIDNYTYDEKWSYNLAGGNYGIWHGGGVSGRGAVTAVTELYW